MGGNVAHYLALDGVHPVAIGAITVTINVILNNFVGVPLMRAQFEHWLHQPRPAKPYWPWLSVFDTGFAIYKPSGKLAAGLVIAIYYGLNLGFGFARLKSDA